jgi:hypothetical protein
LTLNKFVNIAVEQGQSKFSSGWQRRFIWVNLIMQANVERQNGATGQINRGQQAAQGNSYAWALSWYNSTPIHTELPKIWHLKSHNSLLLFNMLEDQLTN